MTFDVDFEEVTNEFDAEFESSTNEFGVEFESTVEVAGGLTEEVKQALLELFQHLAYTDADGQEYYDALYDAFYPPRELANIIAVYTQTGTVYPDTPLDDLKDDLVVTAHYSDGTSEAVTTYTLSGTLTAGTSVITVTYEDKTTTFSVTVSAPAVLSSITAVYTQSGVVYPTDSLDSLKPDLVVTAHYSDSSTATVTTYTLSGSLTVGTSTITVTYSGKTATFNVTVTAVPVLDSITAVYTQSGTVYDTDSLDSLKTDLVVTAVYTDSSTETVPSTNYTLSGTLTAGTSTVTVSYEGKTTTFTVTVTSYWPLVLSIENDFVNFGNSDKYSEDNYTDIPYAKYASSGRTSYPYFDLLISSEYTYTFTYSGSVSIGVPYYSNGVLTAVENHADISSYKTDTGWKTSGYSFTPAADSYCMRLTFNKAKTNVLSSGCTTLTITRTPA